MFLGTVERMRTVDERMSSVGPALRRRVFTVKVIEDFRGLSKPGDEIDVETGLGGPDCGYGFRLGERYLVDVYEDRGKLSTGTCSSTAPEIAAGLMLRELRTQAARARLPDLSGTVLRYSATAEQAEMPSPVSGVPVMLTGSDGSMFRSVTEADGVYQIAILPPGEYTVSFQLPAGLRASSSDDAKELTVKIPNARGSGAACHVDLYATPAVNPKGGQ